MQNLLKRPDCGEQVKCKGEVGVSLSVTITTLTVDASTAAPLLVRMPDSKSTSNGCDAGSSSTSNEGIVVNISPSTAAASTTSDTEAPAPGQEDTRKKMQQMTVNAHANESVVEAKHVFWSTQPVPQLNSDFEKELRDIDTGCPIEVKTVDEISSEPVTLAVDLFEWSDVDVTDDSQLAEAYKLLNQNYVEDGDAMFRFDYSQDFLRWALMPPGWAPSWHVGVRVKKTGKLVAFITAVPATIRVRRDEKRMVEINFLCVHKKLRSKRLAPVLIQEITRRVNKQNLWQAVYTAGAVLPKPVTASRYYHRSLNPKKLIEVGFSRIAPRMTLARTIRLYRLPEQTKNSGIRPMERSDVPSACRLWTAHCKQFDMSVEYSEAEFAHWLLPRERVIYTYVISDPATKEVTDLLSFYSLPSSVIRHPKHSTLNAAYSFCNVAGSVPLVDLMRDGLILANRLDFDVFNALDLAANNCFFDPLHFHIGDGELHYYLYNWKCRPLDRRNNCLVLL
jgi:glycylpeptide N-tetradecanoyltransferase